MIDQGHSHVTVREQVGGQVLLEPLVPVNVLGRGPPHGVRLQHVAQETHHALVEVFGNGENSG